MITRYMFFFPSRRVRACTDSIWDSMDITSLLDASLPVLPDRPSVNCEAQQYMLVNAMLAFGAWLSK